MIYSESSSSKLGQINQLNVGGQQREHAGPYVCGMMVEAYRLVTTKRRYNGESLDDKFETYLTNTPLLGAL